MKSINELESEESVYPMGRAYDSFSECMSFGSIMSRSMLKTVFIVKTKDKFKATFIVPATAPALTITPHS